MRHSADKFYFLISSFRNTEKLLINWQKYTYTKNNDIELHPKLEILPQKITFANDLHNSNSIAFEQ